MNDEHMSVEEAIDVVQWYKKHNSLQALKLSPNIDELFRYIDALEVYNEYLKQKVIEVDQEINAIEEARWAKES